MLKYQIQKNNNFGKYSIFPEISAGNFKIVNSRECSIGNSRWPWYSAAQLMLGASDGRHGRRRLVVGAVGHRPGVIDVKFPTWKSQLARRVADA